MTDIDLDKLEQIAREATSGRWFAGKPFDSYEDGSEMVSVGTFPIDGSDGERPRDHHYEDTLCEVWGGNHNAVANAAHISAFNPETVLELIALAKLGLDRRPLGPELASHVDALTAAGYKVTISR